MGRKRNTQQKKEQGKNPPDQTNEEEISSLPEKEFRVIIVKMIQSLGIEWKKKKNVYQGLRRTKEQTNNDEQHKNEIKNSLDGISCRK